MKPLIVLLILTTFALLIPVPEGGRVIGCLQNAMHVPVFAMVGAALFLVLSNRFKLSRVMLIFLSWVLVCGLGLATEVIQPYVSRTGSWHDLWADMCGGLAGVILATSLDGNLQGRRAGPIAMAGIIFFIGMADPILRLTDAVIQRQEMPIVASFESSLELYRWRFGDCHATRVQKHATDGSWSLRVDLQLGRYPGVALTDPVSDWSGYRDLAIDILLADDRPMDITVKIKDIDHNNDYYDRFNRVVRLQPGGNEILVRLDDVANAPRERQMDLRRISGLSLFTISPSQPRTFYLDNIRLRH